MAMVQTDVGIWGHTGLRRASPPVWGCHTFWVDSPDQETRPYSPRSGF